MYNYTCYLEKDTEVQKGLGINSETYTNKPVEQGFKSNSHNFKAKSLSTVKHPG